MGNALLCTKCGKLDKRYVTVYKVLDYNCNTRLTTNVLCNTALKLITVPLNYFDGKPETVFLTKEEIVELLI